MGANNSKALRLLGSAEDVLALSPQERAQREVLLREQLDLLRQAKSADSTPQDGLATGDEDEGHIVSSLRVIVFPVVKYMSRHFTDRQILGQLTSKKYQTCLESHGWSALAALGPCFMTLAEAGERAGEGKVQASIEEALRSQTSMPKGLREHLLANISSVLEAMREISESYLARSLPKSESGGGTDGKPALPKNKVLEGEHGMYRPVSYINKGSAGVVYAAVRLTAMQTIKQEEPSSNTGSKWTVAKSQMNLSSAAPEFSVSSDVVLKKINATQKDSAENEFRIATKVAMDGGKKFCIPYTDRILEKSGELWLVLQRVKPSNYGIDLTEYIQNGFFQQPGHQQHARAAVAQLLEGLAHVKASGVSMRDVKPDNVLVEFSDAESSFAARWTDFGLAVDLSNEGSKLRRPTIGDTGAELTLALVGWWYDTQKQVPKPKWKNRCPPEGCYQAAAPYAFDTYMVGIIICCIAAGIDFPHLGSKAVDSEVEELLGKPLESDYLTSFEMNAVVGHHKAVFSECFAATFGEEAGGKLLEVTREMLSTDPTLRPPASKALDCLK